MVISYHIWGQDIGYCLTPAFETVSLGMIGLGIPWTTIMGR